VVAVNWKAFAYLMLGTATLTIVVLIAAALSRSGSQAVPHWPEMVRPGALSAKHAFLGQNCEACHAAFSGVESEKCVLCHASDAETLARQSTAFHATVQSCSACHVEHQAGVRPTRMDHDALIAIATSRIHRTPEAADRLDCFSCHSNRSPHRDLLGKECADCHGTESWKVAGFKHPSAASTDCAQCHQAPPSHYMHHFHMISMMVARQHHARVEQCYLCHQTDAWNDIRGVGWYKHH
jgi:hypothetical protein